jgi:hypothetical protein
MEQHTVAPVAMHTVELNGDTCQRSLQVQEIGGRQPQALTVAGSEALYPNLCALRYDALALHSLELACCWAVENAAPPCAASATCPIVKPPPLLHWHCRCRLNQQCTAAANCCPVAAPAGLQQGGLPHRHVRPT